MNFSDTNLHSSTAQAFEPCVALSTLTRLPWTWGKEAVTESRYLALRLRITKFTNVVGNSTECASTTFFYNRGFSTVNSSVSHMGPRFLVSSAEGQLNFHIYSVYLVLGHNSQQS